MRLPILIMISIQLADFCQDENDWIPAKRRKWLYRLKGAYGKVQGPRVMDAPLMVLMT
jgi:hypothetical protein